MPVETVTKQTLNLFLLKSDVTNVVDALTSKVRSSQHLSARADVLPGGTLYYRNPPQRSAGWRAFLAEGFPADLPRLEAKHASAVLFFNAGPRTRQRTFACTFGYGRTMLQESKLVSDFGVRTALMLCKPDTLNAVDYRTIEERTRTGRIQLSDAGSVDAFQMNLDTDLLKGLEAQCKDPRICERFGARWGNLIAVARVKIDALPSLATGLLRAYNRKKLPDGFAWIDHVRKINDPSRIGELDAALETRVASTQFDGIRLAIPEFTGDVSGLTPKLFKAEADAPDFVSDFSAYLAARRQQRDWTVQTAKQSHMVYLLNTSTEMECAKASLYRCIVAEFDDQNEHLLLIDGEWFRLDREYVEAVNAEVRAIPKLKHKFRPWTSDPPEKEDDWNKTAGRSWGKAACIHPANIQYGGGQSKVELCDLLWKPRVIAHVKRRDQHSSGLSHLFAQGVVSAELLSRDPAFVKEALKKVPASHKDEAKEWKNNFDPRRWTIAYVILGADPNDPAGDLPFFSKVNLRGAVNRLKLYGYRVGLIGV